MTLIKIERHIQKQRNKTVFLLLGVQVREVKLLNLRNLEFKEKIMRGQVLGKYMHLSFSWIHFKVMM